PVQQVSVWFDSSEGGFFFECLPVIEDRKAQLALGDTLYQQQRRREVRFVVPADYDVFFTLDNGNFQPLRLTVKDLNHSGVGFEIPQDFQIGVADAVTGILKIGLHQPIKISGKVRRRQMIQNRVYIGVEFSHSAFDSAPEIAERLLFMRHDVYYM